MRWMASAITCGCVELGMDMYNFVDDAKICVNKPFRKLENGPKPYQERRTHLQIHPELKCPGTQIDGHCKLAQIRPYSSILVESIWLASVIQLLFMSTACLSNPFFYSPWSRHSIRSFQNMSWRIIQNWSMYSHFLRRGAALLVAAKMVA